MTVVFALVALVVLCLLVAAHWYLWRRLVRDVSAPGGVWRRTGTVLAFLLPALMTGAVAARGAPFGVQRVLAWPGYLWMATLLYLLLALLAGEVVRPLLRWALGRGVRKNVEGGPPAGPGDPSAGPEPAKPGEAPGEAEDAAGALPASPSPVESPPLESPPVSSSPVSSSRRLFIARGVAVGAAVAATGTVAAGAYGVLNGPTLKHITIPLAKLPRAAHGYRIAVVSDIHLGPILGRSHTQRVVETINSTQPDLVAIVGDLVDGSVAELGHAAEPLARLRSRHGSYFVTGNHEYFGDADEWVDFVRELGVRPLENARSELPWFDLAGVNDIQGERVGEGPDFDRALRGRDPARACVMLAHQPVQVDESVRHGVDLQLSGHTHGGQLWPGNYVAALFNPTVAGYDRFGDTQLYVTRGAGAWGPPVRVGADSDVTVVRLASKQA